MFQWHRIPSNDGAVVNSADTTETEIGSITIPTWAKSIIAVRALHRLITLTTDEEVCGYLRLNNDNNTIDPFYIPLPIAQCLTGALGTHQGYAPVVLPVELPVTPNDTLRAYSAYDAATTGVHTMMAYVCFSSRPARMSMHSQTGAVQTQSTSSVTAAATAINIDTIAGKTNGLVGMWGYVVGGGGLTAAQSVTGYVKVSSDVAGWLLQRLPLNNQPSGLGTQVQPDTAPVVALHNSVMHFPPSGVTLLPFPDVFPVVGKERFTFTGYMDGANTDAPTARFGLIWKE